MFSRLLCFNVEIMPYEVLRVLGKKLNLPVVLTNDANAAAIGEMIYGGAKNRNWKHNIFWREENPIYANKCGINKSSCLN